MMLTEKIAKILDGNGEVVNKIILNADADPAEFNAVWDDESNNARLASMVRSHRDRLLSDIDKVVTNPVRYDALTEQELADLKTYRQALLDVTQQDGFPENVEWPSL